MIGKINILKIIQTSELGLTAQVSADPFKFELWLRRRNRERVNISKS